MKNTNLNNGTESIEILHDLGIPRCVGKYITRLSIIAEYDELIKQMEDEIKRKADNFSNDFYGYNVEYVGNIKDLLQARTTLIAQDVKEAAKLVIKLEKIKEERKKLTLQI